VTAEKVTRAGGRPVPGGLREPGTDPYGVRVMSRIRRSGVVVLLAAACAAPAGCSDGAAGAGEPKAQSVAVPARPEERAPAAAAGGACQLLDLYAVETLIGVRFDVAAAGQSDGALTCVLQQRDAGYPDLTLAITPSGTTPESFTAAAAPPGATDVPGIGRAAYRLMRPAGGTDPAGPGAGAELGWLTRTGQIMVVRCRLPQAAPQPEADAMAERLVDLAKFLDPA
jgi:hypothetical protein